jgi:hypothetical protein
MCNDIDSKGACVQAVVPKQCGVAVEKASLTLACGNGEIISNVLFADYGEPTGQCTVS